MSNREDTVKLLQECDAGTKMGIASLDEVLDVTEHPELKDCLKDCKRDHEALREKVERQLAQYRDEGKEPSPMAKGMSWIKTNVKLALHESDQTIAELMTDGCNMGVKSLYRYLNEYEAAEPEARDTAKKLIRLEEDLARDMRRFL